MARRVRDSFLFRVILAFTIVFGSYNPSGYSLYHWVSSSFSNHGFMGTITSPFLILTTLLLIIGWMMLLHATMRSLGIIGLVLALAFFGVIFWLLVDLGWLSLNSLTVVQYVLLAIISMILAIGVSWAHFWRRLTGQVSVDRVDDDGGSHSQD